MQDIFAVSNFLTQYRGTNTILCTPHQTLQQIFKLIFSTWLQAQTLLQIINHVISNAFAADLNAIDILFEVYGGH